MHELAATYDLENNLKNNATITPEFLVNDDKLEWLNQQLLRNQRAYNLLHPKNEKLIPPSQRGRRVSTSMFVDWINATHFLLGDRDFEYKPQKNTLREKFTTSKFSVMGTALHQLSDLTSLINFGRLDAKSIKFSFPTYGESALVAYNETLDDANGKSLYKIWDIFRDHPGLMNLLIADEAWILQEFPEIEISEELKENLATRRGKEVYDAGCNLIPYFLNQRVQEDANIFLETGTINNLKFPDGNTRLQIPNRSDWIYPYIDEFDRIFVKFVDIKTGTQQTDYANKFQALLMHYINGFFLDGVMRKGYCPRRKDEKPGDEKKDRWYTPRTIDYPIPRSKNYSSEYAHFNTKTGKVTTIPIEINYRDLYGGRFLRSLNFYCNAFNAIGDKIEYYLRTGEVPDVFSKNIYTQNELPHINGTIIDLSNLRPSSLKPEKKYEGPSYVVGESTSEITCERCNKPMTDFIDPKRITDLGGNKIDIWLETYCSGHHHEARKIRILREALI